MNLSLSYKPQTEVQAENDTRKAKIIEKEKFKGKDFRTLSKVQKEDLLEKIAKQLGYL